MADIHLVPSSYDASRVETGIVHLGLGAFHRAHQAVYVEACLARHKGGQWGIAAANLRSNKALVEGLCKAGYRYHVVEYASKDDVTIREIQAIRQAFFAGEDPLPLLEVMAGQATGIVTLTVTEKGYYTGPDGHLLAEDSTIKFDLEHPGKPRTAIGMVVRALELRKENGLAPFTVLSCDNLPENGVRTRRAVLDYAALRSDALAAWIEAHVAFPSSMVDRIVPAMTEQSFADVAKLLGKPDPNAVVAEAFNQWVVEDSFCRGRPDWEADGVQMTTDVRPYEHMKLRLLNGSHSLLAYVGGMAGKETIVECMRDPVLSELVKRYLNTEAGPSLKGVSEATWKTSAASIVKRFGNDSLAHKTNQIAMDGSQKILQRWLAGTVERLEAGAQCPCTALGLAAWLYHMRERDERGHEFPMRDPLRDSLLQAIHPEGENTEAIVDALFTKSGVIPVDLAAYVGYVGQVKSMYRMMREQGVMVAVKAVLA